MAAEAGAVSRRFHVGLATGVLAFLVGAVAALGHAPFSLPPATVAGLAAALWLLLGAGSVRRGALLGWACGVGYFAVSLHWIVEPFLVDAERHGWMAPFGLFFTATGFALFWGAAFGVAAWAGGGTRRAATWAVALAGAEMARSYLLTGFPWGLVGYAWIDTPAAFWVRLVGPFGLTFLTFVVVAAPLAWAWRGGAARLLALPLAVLAPLGCGAALDPGPLPERAEPVTVRLVQPNAAQEEKWDPERALGFLERQIAFTAAEPAVDLVVWPETSLVYYLNDAEPVLERIAAAARGATVVLGAQRVEGLRAFNSLAVIGEGGRVETVYDKHHLVPFGEFTPLGGIGRAIGLPSLAAEDGYGYTAGPGARLVDLGPLGQVLPLICYEAIFPQDVHAAPERPDWLLQITNDAWFGTFAGPYQHLDQARFRAMEQGLPMVRAANTGVSAVIDARGKVTASIPLGEAGFLDVPLPAGLDAPLYARTGDVPVAGGLGMALLALLARRRKRG